MFTKILIANRGEIACRVIKTARRMGIATVAVYSDADATARHVRLADEAVHIGPSPARESYLVGEKILAAAKATGAAGDPPGLRLPLGERGLRRGRARRRASSSSARRPSAIRAMGSKSAAKSLMEKAGVPLTPGYHGDDQDPALLARRKPARIGYPVLIKASAGGGGKGMRRVDAAARLRRRARLVPARGEERVRRRPRAGRAVRAAAAAHRDPGVRRQPRRLRLPVRARLLGAAPAPEGARGSARAGHDRRAPRGDGPGGGGSGQGGRLRRRRHGRVHRPSGRPLLLHGDEHAAAGRASGHRDDHRRSTWSSGSCASPPASRCRCSRSELAIAGHAIEARIYAEDPDRGFLPSTGKLRAPRAAAEGRRRRARRHRRRAGRLDHAVLRPDDRQADRPRRRPRRRRWRR